MIQAVVKPADKPSPAPAFPVGFRVSIGYMGLARAGEPACRRDGEPLPVGNGVIESIRLHADAEEREIPGSDLTEFVTTYPAGWEYMIVTIGSRSVHGWYPETALVNEGYVPTRTVPTITPQDEVYMSCDPNAPLVCDVCGQVLPQLHGGQQTADAVVCGSCATWLRARAETAAAVVAPTDAELTNLPGHAPDLGEAGA